MSDTDIFLSYSRADREVVRKFARALVDAGFSVWWDAALHSGETFDEVIERQLRAAKAVVVLWSPRSVKSRWVRAEATLADRRDKLVPVVIEACDRPIIFELAHTIDLSHWQGDAADAAWQNFLADVQRLVGKEAAPVAPKVTAPAPEPVSPAPPPQVAAVRDPAPAPTQAAEAKAVPLDDDDDYQPTQFFTHAAPPSTSHWLLHPNAEKPEMRYAIGPLGLKIGRAQSADVVVQDSQISRTHCMVQLKDGELHVLDLGSTNGTFVDNQKIGGEAVLQVGSTLRIGDFLLVHEVCAPGTE